MKAPVDAIVWLKPPLWLAGTLAGWSGTVQINGREMSLTLPTESAPLEEPSPPPKIPEFPPPPLADGFSRGSARTRVAAAVRDEDFVAGAIRLRFSSPQLRARLGSVGATEDFSNAIDVWLARVRDWLYAWATRPGHEFRIAPTPAFRLALPDAPERGTESGGGSHGVIVLGERRATPTEWESALRTASAGEDVPLPYRLLSQAILHRTGREPRNAVITACSAAEVTLGEVARAGLAAVGWTPKEADKILKNANGLIDLYRVCAALPDRLPVSIGAAMSKLANPRNLATHQGEDDLSAEVVGSAISTAVKFVKLRPLARPTAGAES